MTSKFTFSFLLFCFLSSPFLLFGQTTLDKTNIPALPSTKSAYAELGGNGILFTFNYDARFNKQKTEGFGYRIGFGGFAVADFGATTVPISINYLASKDNRNYFEAGMGLTYVSETLDIAGEDSNIYGTMQFGYRFQPSDKGFLFRTGLSPIFGLKSDGNPYFFPFFPCLAFGYSF